ncbi:hypothetical protein B0I33_101525 [Prauserella shujinwangii]|uniref:Mycofactocin binding protein MftB n=2 Tax=Prauserella shujinwangii TaxID=1453103 RepID=A0A2T0M3N9_9PSEU|nr:hypothetical protein B0I33_101525 [Prauserella shujinwangii]
MAHAVRLAEHVVFTELPFCGVLLDKRNLRLYRLSQEASAALRTALHGSAACGPYDGVTRLEGDVVDPATRQRVIGTLLAQELLRSAGGADG